MHLALSDFDSQDLIFKFSGEVKSSHLYLNRVAPSAIKRMQLKKSVFSTITRSVKI